MKSMTGYGEGAADGKLGRVAVQLRSTNHRHLDIQLKLPREYLTIEEEIRERIRERIARGRLELYISRLPSGAQRIVRLDEHLLAQLVREWRRAKRKFGLEGEVDLELLAMRPELLEIRDVQPRLAEERRLVLRAFRSALKGLEESRRREGRLLQKDMLGHLRSLRRVGRVLAREAARSGRSPAGAGGRSGEVAPGGEPRAAEATNGGLKGDIHEEVVRFSSHVGELSRVLRQRGPVGKRIDFLLQEILRELNTIGSKAPQLPVIRAVLEGKERVEKLREQAQNIE
jgi:uncharacterized protein YicC (UPF0701 family)